MAKKQRRRAEARGTGDPLQMLCGEVGDDDGIDLRVLARREKRSETNDNTFLRRDRQVCKEAFYALSLALAAERSALAQLALISVTPRPDASRLEALLACPDDTDVEQALALEAKLARRASALRVQLATALGRKRAPELELRLVPAEVARD